MRAALGRGQPGALEMDAGDRAVLDQRLERADLLEQPLERPGDERRKQARGPVPEVGRGGCRRRLGRDSESGSTSAVAVDVDETGNDDVVAEGQGRGASGTPSATSTTRASETRIQPGRNTRSGVTTAAAVRTWSMTAATLTHAQANAVT